MYSMYVHTHVQMYSMYVHTHVQMYSVYMPTRRSNCRLEMALTNILRVGEGPLHVQGDVGHPS
jgi:hypothetical protein